MVLWFLVSFKNFASSDLIFYLVHANINLIGAEKKPAEKMTHYILT